MRLTIETTPTGWEQKLMINGVVFALTARMGEDGVMRSDEGYSFGDMMEQRGVDPDICDQVRRLVDRRVAFDVGEGMFAMVEEGIVR